MEKLEVRHVSKSFDGRRVLEDISITLRAGELVCLLGASGGGKTTLFNIISGLSKPEEGEVLLDGADVTGRPGQHQLHAAKGSAAALPHHSGQCGAAAVAAGAE